jgi:hypothetical protein
MTMSAGSTLFSQEGRGDRSGNRSFLYEASAERTKSAKLAEYRWDR